jgi:hypothetical protein
MKKIYLLFLLGITLCSCKPGNKSNHEDSLNQLRFSGDSIESVFKKGTFGYDRKFLQEHYKNTIVLESDDHRSKLILSPELQGRVMSSTLNGEKGMSFGWLNYDLIRSKEIMKHINPAGGEERIWLGPEGGQFSLFFKPRVSFDFENWFVPPVMDTEAFDVTEQIKSSATFKKEMNLVNYSGTEFNIDLTRKVTLLQKARVRDYLQLEEENFSVVAYETENTVKNTGESIWEKETGLVSIWLLSMLNSSEETTVVVPVKQGKADQLGPPVNDNYFGRIGSDRLKVTEKTVFFKADGKSRGKIGISPKRTTGIMGSYDSKNRVLTILEISEPKAEDVYVNSAWELQKDPYSGDVLNSYNDGKLEDGTQMGPFYELESSSPALSLAVGESYRHIQRLYHFKGDKDALNSIALKVLKVTVDEVERVFSH